jgi:hypothetical protein
MTLVKDKCDMFGCHELACQALTLGPRTSLRLCLRHFPQEHEDIEKITGGNALAFFRRVMR